MGGNLQGVVPKDCHQLLTRHLALQLSLQLKALYNRIPAFTLACIRGNLTKCA